MIIGVQATIQNGEVVRQGLEDLTGEFLKVGRLQLYRTALRIKTRASKEPGRFRGKWIPLSEEQRRYVFFLYKGSKVGGRFGTSNTRIGPFATHPYTRTHAYRKSFKIVKDDQGYTLLAGGGRIPSSSMSLGAPYGIPYVGGDPVGGGQSFLNRGRWPVIAMVAAEEEKNLPNMIKKEMGLAAVRKGYRWE